jgi:uncharacterized protein (TIGR03790 family)
MRFFRLAAAILSALNTLAADTTREDVAVVFNSDVRASGEVAEYYAARRGIPTNHCIGLPMPSAEAISRAEFESRIEEPLLSELKARALIQTRLDIQPATPTSPGRISQVLVDSRIRYLVLCHGVPIRVREDPTRREALGPNVPEALHRNEAAVDAELTVLPLLIRGAARTGPIVNIWYGATNAADLSPANGLFVVGRLDGPTPLMARALVDRAIEAERNGLLGRGYFDLRAATDAAYRSGDIWISNAWKIVKGYGYDTYLETTPATLPAGFPLSHVAFYAGWYDAHASGPFALPAVEFMPGAIAYHLHSYSAQTLRSTQQHWVGPLVARGVTATMGTVAEPYLDGTPDIGLCMARLLYSDFTWGEAALASQRMLSWQLTVIGDPLYQPFATNVLERAKELAARGQGRLDWALVALYNRKLAATSDLPAIIAELEKEPRIRFSPILQEKLGEFYNEAGQSGKAAEAYKRAARWRASPQQLKRLLWNMAQCYEAAGEKSEAYKAYEELARAEAQPPREIELYQKLQSLATSLRKDGDAKRWTAELDRLKSAPVPPR